MGSLGADEDRLRRVVCEHRFRLYGFSFDVSASAGVTVIDGALDADAFAASRSA